MENELEQQLLQRLSELPEDIRKAVQDAGLTSKVHTIAQKYQLHIDQSAELEQETMLVMLGFTPAASFEKRLAEALHITPEVGSTIAADVSNQIFLPIRESMKKFAAEKEKAVPAPLPASVPHPADVMLSQKTVTTAPTAPLKPEPYKADPYREPVE